MIRQFLATTVENLRSFFSSLAGGTPEHSADDFAPDSRAPGAYRRQLSDASAADSVEPDPAAFDSAYTEPYFEEDDPDYEPHPESRRVSRATRRNTFTAPDSETQRRRLRAAGLLPAPATGAPSVPEVARQEAETGQPSPSATPNRPPETGRSGPPVGDSRARSEAQTSPASTESAASASAFTASTSTVPPSPARQTVADDATDKAADDKAADKTAADKTVENVTEDAFQASTVGAQDAPPTAQSPEAPRTRPRSRALRKSAAETLPRHDAVESAVKSADESGAPESPSAPTPAPTLADLRRPARPPHLFPTQAVPAPASMPKPELYETDVAVETDIAPEIAPDPDADADPESLPESPSVEVSPDGSRAPVAAEKSGVHERAAAFSELHAVLESLLFVASEPLGVAQLARVLDMPEADVTGALQELAQTYARQNRGLRLQNHRDKYQIVSAPGAAAHIERLLNLDTSSKLSGPALETLAVVAYRQPVTRSQIEAVRGVDCAAVLRSLAQRGLIDEVGRLDAPGRPFLYGVTDFFMQHFGLTDLGELPPLEQTEADTLWAATALAELEGQNPEESAEEGAEASAEPAEEADAAESENGQDRSD